MNRRQFVRNSTCVLAAAPIMNSAFGESTAASGGTLSPRGRRESENVAPTHQLHFLQPGTDWTEGLPTGNGKVGACVYGRIHEDIVLLNHNRLYLPQAKPDLPDVSEHLPELRRLLDKGDFPTAATFLMRKLQDAGYDPVEPAPFQPACDLLVDTVPESAFHHYRRLIDMPSGEVRVEWQEDDLHFQRRLFASRVDDLIALRFDGDAPRDFRLQFTSHNQKWRDSKTSEGIHVVSQDPPPSPFSITDPPAVNFRMWAEGRFIHFEGRYDSGEIYGGVFLLRPGEGKVTIEKDLRLKVEGSQRIEAIGDLFCFEPDADRARAELVKRLESVELGYDELLARHAASHGELYNRVSLKLGEERENTTIERLLLDAYEGDGAAPPELIQKFFDYGRYLAICSNAPGHWPNNLQGIWNGDYRPMFACDFHHNINLQMNYWLMGPCAMPELIEPLIDHCLRWMEDYRTNARNLYGCRGILAANNQTTDGLMRVYPWANWPSAGPWLAQHLFDHYLFTGDETILREKTLPFMLEVALFYEDYLVEGKDGKLHVSPSVSPENYPSFEGTCRVTVDASVDVACCRELLGNLIQTCEILGVHPEKTALWQEMRERLPGYRVNEDGALAEWIDPRFPDNYEHRHLSHLYPLYPGLEFDAESPFWEPAKVAVEKRLALGLEAQTNWSLAWLTALFARTRQSEQAEACIDLLCRSCVSSNLWTRANDWRRMGLTVSFFGTAPFQIDGNFGTTAAIAEMLFHSRPGEILLLPGLPKAWNQGTFSGGLCRGGIRLERLAWNLQEKRVEVTLRNTRRSAISARVMLAETPTTSAIPGPRSLPVELKPEASQDFLFSL